MNAQNKQLDGGVPDLDDDPDPDDPDDPNPGPSKVHKATVITKKQDQ